LPHPAFLLCAVLVIAIGDGGSAAAKAEHKAIVPVQSFEVFKFDSGPVNYYSVLTEGDTQLIHAAYKPGWANYVLYGVVPEQARQSVTRVSWRWRVHTLPKDSNDCGPGFSDNAASVFMAFKAGMKFMVIKYVWSTLGTPGASCQSTRGWFFDRDTILAQVGGPLDVWTAMEVDPRAEFVRRFGGAAKNVPDFVGIGIMTDGDNSQSPAEADYADFVVYW
jgi:Protein of unknown function (DUF3047)